MGFIDNKEIVKSLISEKQFQNLIKNFNRTLDQILKLMKLCLFLLHQDGFLRKS